MRDRRMKAQDVFNAMDFVFARKTSSFEEAFPQIADLRVEVEEFGDGVYRTWALDGGKRTYTREFPPGEYVNCSNPICYNGGIGIGQILRSMIYQRQTQLEETRLCQGNEASPKGRRVYRKCLNSFKIKVTLTYKDAQSQNGTREETKQTK